MKIGIGTIPTAGVATHPSAVIERFLEFGRKTEALGFEGLWTTDAFARGNASLDPLMLMSALCGVTRRIELGTCVMQVPLRHPVELAHRAQTLAVLSGGRFRFGVGSGSTKHDFDAVQVDYDRRFKLLPEYLAVMRRVWAGEAVFGPVLGVWPHTEGGPPVYLGAWRSARWIDLAARHCAGWIASGIYADLAELKIGADMFRAAGGKRAILANVFVDLRPEPEIHPVIARAKVHMVCDKAEARDRFRRIQDIGVDDVLLVCPFGDIAQLDVIREIVG